MSYGIAAFGTDGKIAFHSDYSSVVYAGEMAKTSASPARPTYTGDYHIPITTSLKTTNYDMGFIVQYRITLNSSFLLPFYKPSFSGQQICVMDVVRSGTSWVVNVLYSGSSLQWPLVYAFAPLSELPNSSIAMNSHGIAVYDADSNLVFTDGTRPLRVDDVVTIQHNNDIKTNSKGSCGNSNSCHVNLTSNVEANFSGPTHQTSKLYHIIPSAYGGLAYENSGSGNRSCGFLNLFTRKYAWAYRSWASYRGTVEHRSGNYLHRAGWLADYAGAAHQYNQGSCGFGGFLGALLGVIAVIATGGAAAPLILAGGALAGFVIGELSVGTAPDVASYDSDEVVDTANAVNMLVTDTSYYGIVNNGYVNVTDRLTYSYSHNSLDASNWTQWIWSNSIYGTSFSVYNNGTVEVLAGSFVGTTAPHSSTTSYTSGNSTYYRGPLQATEYFIPGNIAYYTKRYEVAVVQG